MFLNIVESHSSCCGGDSLNSGQTSCNNCLHNSEQCSNISNCNYVNQILFNADSSGIINLYATCNNGNFKRFGDYTSSYTYSMNCPYGFNTITMHSDYWNNTIDS